MIAGLHIQDPDPVVPELSYLGEGWVPESWDIPPHQHPVWEVYWQADRSSLWSSDGRTFELGAGDLLLAAPGRVHGLVNRPTGNFHFIAVGFDLAPVQARLPGIAPAFAGRDLVHVAEAVAIEAPLRELVREARLLLPHRSLGLRAAVDRLVLELARLLLPLPVSALVPMHAGVQRAKALIDAHCERPWLLAELARAAGLSPCHLATRFAGEVGEPPRRYLLRRRLERARHLLAHTDEAVTDIALGLGFCSSQHLARAFLAGTGCTASAYRARFQTRTSG